MELRFGYIIAAIPVALLLLAGGCGDPEVLGLFNKEGRALSVVVSRPLPDQVIGTNELLVSGTVQDTWALGVLGVYFSYDGGGYTLLPGTGSWSTNLTGIAYGSHTLRVYAMDTLSNTSATNEVSFISIVDTVSPSVSVTNPAPGAELSTNSILVSGTASDTGSWVTAVYLSLNGGAFAPVSGTNSWNTNLVDLANGSYQIRVFAVDALGNYSATNQVDFQVSWWGQYGTTYTVIVANGTDLRISTNGFTSYYSIYTNDRMIVGCSVDRYRNIYVSATNVGTIDTGYYGVVRGFTSYVDYSTYTTGNAAGICANDDYGNFYSYEIIGTSVGGAYSTDFGTNYGWLSESTIGQAGVGVCYVACNPSGYVVLGRNNGTLSVRSGGSGTFTTVDPNGNTYGAHQMALTTNSTPTITFIENGQYLRSSDDSYTEYNLGSYVSSLYYQGQRLWVGFSGAVAYSDDHGQNLTYPGSANLPSEDITAIAIDSTGLMYVGTRAGKLYTSNDDGATFTERYTWGNYISQIMVID